MEVSQGLAYGLSKDEILGIMFSDFVAMQHTIDHYHDYIGHALSSGKGFKASKATSKADSASRSEAKAPSGFGFIAGGAVDPDAGSPISDEERAQPKEKSEKSSKKKKCGSTKGDNGGFVQKCAECKQKRYRCACFTKLVLIWFYLTDIFS
jgi:hypothetical protein